MSKEPTTQAINTDFEPMSWEKLKEAINGFKPIKIERQKQVYLSLSTFDKIRLSIKVSHNGIRTGIVHPYFFGVTINADNDVADNEFFICEPRLFEIWKQLKNHPWIDHNDPKIDICKIATWLYEYELKGLKKRFETWLDVGVLKHNQEIYDNVRNFKDAFINEQLKRPNATKK